ncbi:AraC family transcriptional regulator [Pukyongiella litopenaei]|uniref:AraC family transcriptional regulator n=1 Tax=Pukyongiella litopenaei TaxID=2605946 RepID=UPI001FCF28BA|nr:AraC family transcriptional regulator [Pukyongiella litopenaei]
MSRTDYETRVRRVIQYIYDHPDGDLSLDQLADVAAMSRFHWHRVFRAMTGETCARAVRRIRAHRAACWLVQTDWPVEIVAARAGYDNPQSFARLFRRFYGQGPGEFRAAGVAHALPTELTRGDLVMHPTEIRDLPARRLAALTHTGPFPEIGRAFQEVSAVFTARNLWPHARGMAAVYYSDPGETPESELHSEAGVIVAETLDMPADLHAVDLPAGPHAVMTVKGDYSGLAAAWEAMYSGFLPDCGRDPANRAPFEVYLNDPSQTAPEDLLTEICVPLA